MPQRAPLKFTELFSDSALVPLALARKLDRDDGRQAALPFKLRLVEPAPASTPPPQR